jgi:WD40 repeat protein
MQQMHQAGIIWRSMTALANLLTGLRRCSRFGICVVLILLSLVLFTMVLRMLTSPKDDKDGVNDNELAATNAADKQAIAPRNARRLPMVCDAVNAESMLGSPAAQLDTGETSCRVGCFSPDGRYCLIGCYDGALFIWDLQQENHRRRFRAEGQGGINSIAVDRTSSLVLTGSSRPATIVLWDLKTERYRRTVVPSDSFGGGALAGLGFVTGDNPCIYSVMEDAVGFLDIHGAITHSYTCSTSYLQVFPNGKSFATGGARGGVTVRDTDKLEVKSEFSTRCWQSPIAVSADGKIVASADCQAPFDISLWDLESGAKMGTLSGHTSEITSMAFHPDDKALVSASDDDSTVRLWDLAKQEEVWRLTKTPDRVKEPGIGQSGLVFVSPDGKYLAVCIGRTTFIWSYRIIRSFDRNRVSP